jgi:hypothetical protein
MSGRRVILAARNAERISTRNVDAVVIDVVKQVIWQAGEPWCVSGLGHQKPAGRPVLGSLNFRFHVMMICGHGRMVSYDEICTEFWGLTDHGGPLDTARYLSVLRCRAAPLFDWLGLSLETRRNVGFLPTFAERHSFAKAA